MDDHGSYMREALNTMGALLLGRLTYDIWAPYWPTVTDPADEIARMLNAVPKYVASTTLDAGSWPQTAVLADVDASVHELKRMHAKDVVVMGSAELAQTLMRLDAIDEYRLMLHPVVLGEGKRLFRNGPPGHFSLSSTTTTTSGLVTIVYRTERTATMA
jgi:dihydrofolate reductase